jgi:hypothetical protein
LLSADVKRFVSRSALLCFGAFILRSYSKLRGNALSFKTCFARHELRSARIPDQLGLTVLAFTGVTTAFSVKGEKAFLPCRLGMESVRGLEGRFFRPIKSKNDRIKTPNDVDVKA